MTQYLKTITLTAKTESAVPPIMDIEREYDRPFDLFPRERARITGIDLDHWTLTLRQDYADDFKKVASVVGKDNAQAVLDALKRAVPEDWETAVD
ncbi:hypothetical protein [Amycolatopsis minnesotensis]|uniref:Uncharacterized protein n=1 Tax=Amycolatopsis minnesotensis TaxID=337894 RepID=A0ABP5BBR4_9PSEU